MKKTGVLFIENIYHQLLDRSNKVDNLEYLSCTVGLVALEMGAEQVITELFRLILAVQTKIVDEYTFIPLTHQCALHALLASTISLLVQLINLQSLSEHIYTVIQRRRKIAPWLLPSVAFNRTNTVDSYPTEFETNDDFVLSIPYNPIYLPLYDTGPRDPLFDSAANPSVGVIEHSNYQANCYNEDSNLNVGTLNPGSGRINSIHMDGTMQSCRSSQNGTNFTQSGSSFSLTDSLYSMADSANMLDEFLSFKNMRKLITDSEGTQKVSQIYEEDNLLSGCLNAIEFNEICAQQREKAHSVRAHMAEIFDDISCQLYPHDVIMNGPKKIQGRDNNPLFLNESSNQVNSSVNSSVGNFIRSSVGSGIKPSKKVSKSNQPIWEREFGSLFFV
ncbi:unnamed protein product [Heterobilharzia americana]|nr:unnamed protein product [Heterobilharzia americana]